MAYVGTHIRASPRNTFAPFLPNDRPPGPTLPSVPRQTGDENGGSRPPDRSLVL